MSSLRRHERAATDVVVAAVFVLCAMLGVQSSQAADGWVRTGGPGVIGITALTSEGSVVFAGSAALGVFRSNDDGVSWSSANLGMEQNRVLCFAHSPGGLIAGSDFGGSSSGGIHRTTNGGASWIPIGLQGQAVYSLAGDGAFLYAGTGTGAARSTNGGATWVPANDGLFGASVYGLAVVDGAIFAAASQGMFRSDDHAASWSPVPGLEFFNFFSLLADGDEIFAGAFDRVLRSTDGGASFEAFDLPVQGLARISALAVDGGTIYAGAGGFGSSGVFRSTDGGIHWSVASNEIVLVSINALLPTTAGILAGAEERGALLSSDGGAHWITRNVGLPPGGNLREMLVHGSDLFAATGGNGVWRSNDHGDSWSAASNSDNGQLTSELVFSLTARGSVLFAGTSFNGVYRSTNDAASWTRVNGGLPLGAITAMSLASIGSSVVAGTTKGIYQSTNDGANWSLRTSDTFQCQDLASADGFLYGLVSTGFGTSTGIYRSSNSGASWTLIFPSGGLTLTSLAADGAFVYTGDLLAGMLRSTDHGLSWNSVDPAPGVGVFSIAARGAEVYAGCEPASDRVFRSTDRGSHWTVWNDGLPASASVEALTLEPSYLFAGTDRLGVWRRVLPGATDVPAPLATTLAVWPNPARDLLWLRLPTTSDRPAQINLFDVTGARVSGWSLSPDAKGAMRISTAALPRGTYFLSAEVQGKTRFARFVLVR